MKALKVVFEPDQDGWWSVSIPDLAGVRSDGRTLEEARRRVREALALADDLGWDDSKAAAVEFIEDIRLPAEIRELLDDRTKALAALATASELVEKSTTEIIRRLTKEGRSLRDVAGLLGLSHGRVHQILGHKREKKTTTSDRRATRYFVVKNLPLRTAVVGTKVAGTKKKHRGLVVTAKKLSPSSEKRPSKD